MSWKTTNQLRDDFFNVSVNLLDYSLVNRGGSEGVVCDRLEGAFLDATNTSMYSEGSPGSGVLVDMDNQTVFTSMMSPDSGYDDDTRTPGLPASARPYLQIVEQPEFAHRFRYLKESTKPHGALRCRRTVGLPQKDSCGPKVKLANFAGTAIIRMWLYGPQKDGDSGNYGPSPHRLVKTEKGPSSEKEESLVDEPHDIEVNEGNDYTASFDKFNVVHTVVKEGLYHKLYLRKTGNVSEDGDLYTPKDKFQEVDEVFNRQIKDEWKNKDKDVCALYFEAFEKRGDEYVKICSVLSDKIKNRKSAKTNPLKIKKVSHTEGSCEGGTEIMMFTDKIVKEIKIIFEDRESNWQEEIEGSDLHVHVQVALAFKTPPFLSVDIREPVTVKYYILRTTDQETSDYCEFRYLPRRNDDFAHLSSVCRECEQHAIKRKKANHDGSNRFLEECSAPSSGMMLLCDEDEIDDPLISFAREINLNDGMSEFGELTDSDRLTKEVGTDELVDIGLPSVSVYMDILMDAAVSSSPTDDIESLKKLKRPHMCVRERTRLLHCSILANNYGKFRTLAAADTVNFQLRNKSSLHLAVLTERLPMIGHLLQLGADPYALDGDSNTAVHLAIERSLISLQAMLSAGLKQRAVFNKDGDDSVLYAVRLGNIPALKSLLYKEFKPLARNIKDGDSPLHVAIKCKDEHTRRTMVDLLLKHESLVSVVNGDGISPMTLAESVGDESIMKQLKPYCESNDDDRDDLTEQLASLELEKSSSTKASSTESSPGCAPEKLYLALDGDAVTSTKVAELMGITFLTPLLANAEKQSEILLAHLERTSSREEAEAKLNRLVETLKNCDL